MLRSTRRRGQWSPCSAMTCTGNETLASTLARETLPPHSDLRSVLAATASSPTTASKEVTNSKTHFEAPTVSVVHHAMKALALIVEAVARAPSCRVVRITPIVATLELCLIIPQQAVWSLEGCAFDTGQSRNLKTCSEGQVLVRAEAAVRCFPRFQPRPVALTNQTHRDREQVFHGLHGSSDYNRIL